MKFFSRRWPVVFLLLTPLLVLWPAVFGGQAIGPWDHIRTMSPWSGPMPSAPWDVLQADGVLQFAPWRSLVFESWSHGQIPLWNHYQLMGTPLLANSQSGGFYPLHILVGVLHIPLYSAMTFLAWFHLFWAGLGCYLLVRRMGGTKTGGVVAGASFSLSAFMVYWTALPSVITTVSWIPWALACTIAVFQTDQMWEVFQPARFQSVSGSPREALDETLRQARSQSGWKACLIVCVAMMALAGHLQFLAFGLFAMIGVAITMGYRMWQQPTNDAIVMVKTIGRIDPKEKGARKVALGMAIRLLVSCALAISFGLCIAAPQLLPVLEFGKHSHRKSSPTPEGYAAYVNSAIRPFELASLEFPKMTGDPSLSAGDEQNHSLFWPAIIKPGANFGESALAMGPLILLLLCCLTKARWKRGSPLIAVALLGILIACGTPIDWLLYYGIPGWSSTGSPGRAIVLFVLAACCLAGLAIRPKEEMRKDTILRGLVTFTAISVLLFFISIYALENMETSVPMLSNMILKAREINQPVFLITFLLAIGTAVIWIRQPKVFKTTLLVAAPIIPLVLSLGVLRFGAPIQPTTANNFERLAFQNSRWNLFITPMAMMPPNMSILLRQHDVAGYDSLLDAETKQLLDAANKQDSSPPENGNMMFIKPTADPMALARLGVDAYIVGQQQVITGGKRVSIDNPQVKAPSITSEDFRSISVSADGPGTLTLRDRNMPGWTAKVDGKDLPIKAGPFREIDLPVGSHLVVFTYWPPGLTPGLVLFLLGMLLLVGNILGWRRKPLVGSP